MFPITSHFVIHSNYHILLIATHSTTLGEPDQQTIADEVVIIKHMQVELARWWLGRGGIQTDDGRAVEVVGGEGDDGGEGVVKVEGGDLLYSATSARTESLMRFLM